MLRLDKVKDGCVNTTDCVGPLYVKIIIFYILSHMRNLVFYWGLYIVSQRDVTTYHFSNFILYFSRLKSV
jgi:hypothetical protein